MVEMTATDEELLTNGDPASFELLYRRYVEMVLGFFARRTHDAEMAADLTAETFAAAWAGRRRYRSEAGAARAWVFGIALKKLIDAQRRGYAERGACQRLGMERIELHDDDIRHIEALGEAISATSLLQILPEEQREAISEHVLGERSYQEIADRQQVSQVVVRKRVSRGLAVIRERMEKRQ